TAVALPAGRLCPRGTPPCFPAGSSLVGKPAPVGAGSGSKDARSPARKVAPREVRQAAAVVPGRAEPTARAVPVQHPERPAEGIGGERPVRIPPRRRHPPAVGVDELHLRAGVQAVLRVCPAEARLLHAAPRGLPGPVRIGHVVRPHRSRRQTRREPPRPCEVPRPDACAEPEPRRVRERHRLFLVRERRRRDPRPEDLLRPAPTPPPPPHHDWPRLDNAPQSAPSAAGSRAASRRTSIGPLPPSSRGTRRSSCAHAPPIRRPTSVDPVKKTFAIPGSRTSATPTSSPE